MHKLQKMQHKLQYPQYFEHKNTVHCGMVGAHGCAPRLKCDILNLELDFTLDVIEVVTLFEIIKKSRLCGMPIKALLCQRA